ncbi:hypothetical protein IW262DRAFT_974709 [Armillaria fumosa]|nr:hypothetical protein IW262DRAFT_974709 [Armillaria fumosa]
MAQFSKLSAAGTFLVDQLPFLRFLPEWLPGMGFKRLTCEWRKGPNNLANDPFNSVKGLVARCRYGEAVVCLGSASRELSLVIRYQVGCVNHLWRRSRNNILSLGCSISSHGSVSPSVWKQAQVELDTLLNNGERLPSLSVRDKLPYINTLFLEI